MKKQAILTILLLSNAASADMVYKCKSGIKTLYSDRPCPASAIVLYQFHVSRSYSMPKQVAEHISLKNRDAEFQKSFDYIEREARRQEKVGNHFAAADLRSTAFMGAIQYQKSKIELEAKKPQLSEENSSYSTVQSVPPPNIIKYPPPPAPPSIITTCDPAGCWDNMGKRYTKIGANMLLPVTGGKPCVGAGNVLLCH